MQCLRRYGEALAAFSAGLAQDANSKQLLSGLIEASIKSPLRAALEPTLNQLFTMKLDQVMQINRFNKCMNGELIQFVLLLVVW